MDALTRWENSHEFADRILHRVFATHHFSTLDRALFTEMFYGIIRNKRMLDFLITQLREGGEVEDDARQVLRLGVYQIFQTRIPHHAVVNETVELAGRARKLVNAILRRCIREEKALRQHIEAASLGVRYSHPELLIERWNTHFGEENTHRLCAWNNAPAEVFVRANSLRVSRGELLRTADADPVEAHPLMIRVKQLPLVWLANGLCYVQDPSTLVACELLDPKPGEHVLDACAAPGGKTSYMAELMHNEGKIIACDASAKRLARLRENIARLGITNTSCLQLDWLKDASRFPENEFDRILVDAPCSNTGVIRRRVDVRWRLSPEEFSRLHEMQLDLLRKLVPLLKSGGRLVYSTCSIEPEENEHLVRRVEKEMPELQFIESRKVLPFRDGMDGAFAASFKRAV